MKYLIALLVIGMIFFTACGNKTDPGLDETDGYLPEANDGVPEENTLPPMPDESSTGGEIDDSIIGDGSDIDTEGAENALNDW